MHKSTDAGYTFVKMYCVEDDVNKKWKYLRTQYTDEIKKEKNMKSGMGAEEVYISKWRWMSMMAFLGGHVCLRSKTVTNLHVCTGKVGHIFIFYNH